MSLDTSRQALREYLIGNTATNIDSEGKWGYLIGLITPWWIDLKLWESRDTFNDAYQSGRMTVRAINAAQPELRTMEIVQKRTLATGEEQVLPNKIVPIRGGREGIVMRTNPTNFYTPSEDAIGIRIGGSKKYDLGLHDLCASLLNPRRPWYQNPPRDDFVDPWGTMSWKPGPLNASLQKSTFGQMKPYPGATYAFMPLPEELDLETFFILTGMIKGQPCPERFKNMLHYFSSMLTRIQYAQNRDMGTGYRDLGFEDNLGRMKLKMGQTGLADYKTNRGDTTYAPVTEIDVARRRELAVRYRSILKDETNSPYNEITLTYRCHGFPTVPTRFPLFAVMTNSRFAFVVDAGKREVITSEGRLEVVSTQEFNALVN
jgi:hypothetical protein